MKKHIYTIVILILVFSSCSTEKEEPNTQSQYPESSVFGANGPTKIVDVTNPKTGKTWMDRNLGATRAATSSTDAESFGDLYQWGRRADGHQLRNSNTTKTVSSIDKTENGNFIISDDFKTTDWRNPQNNDLWQGVNGVSNPCPKGYRLPTEAELNEEFLSWNTNNAEGAFASPIKLPVAGIRQRNNGSIIGTTSGYWSSTVKSPVTFPPQPSYSISLTLAEFSGAGGGFKGFRWTVYLGGNRNDGLCVRCIKN